MLVERKSSEKFIIENLSYLKTQISILLLIAIASLLSIFYIVTQDTLKEAKEEAIRQFTLIENYTYSSILNAEQVINGLSFLISKSNIQTNNKDLFDLVSNFDYKAKDFKAIAFSSLVILNKYDFSVASSSSNIKNFKSKDFSEAKCLNQTKTHPLQLQIGKITSGLYSKETIIPLGIAIFKEQAFLGSICTGLSVSNLKAQMSDNLLHEYFYNVELSNKENQEEAYEINSFFNFSNLIKYYLLKEKPKLFKGLNDYPYIIYASINTDTLYSKLKVKIWICFNYSLLFFSFVLLLFLVIKRFYGAPFAAIKDAILALPIQLLSKATGSNSNLAIINSKDYSPSHLQDTITYLTKHLQKIYENEEKLKFEQYTQEIRRKVMHLALIEHHYSPVAKISKAKHAELYHNSLVNFVHEESQSMFLNDYLQEIRSYYVEYFYSMSIILQVSSSENKSFTFKYAALTETIFQILSFIERAAISSIDTDAVTITPNFKDQDDFPTIAIEIGWLQNSQTSIGWEVGALFPYMNLLPIYLLAKENNLTLNIEQNDTKMAFILKPFTDAKF